MHGIKLGPNAFNIRAPMARSFLTIKFTSNNSTNWTWKNFNFRFKRFYVLFLCKFLIPDCWIKCLISRYVHVWNKRSLNSRTFSVVPTNKIRISSIYMAFLICTLLFRTGPARRNDLARPGPTLSVPEHAPN